jgi:hypothetical protein
MPITKDWTKLLPSNLKSVTKWKEFIQAYQSTIASLKDEKITTIHDQWIIDKATETDLKNLLIRFGWNLSYYEGWAITKEYLKREVETIIKRILYKNGRKAYIAEGYIFNLYADVYPLVKIVEDNSISPFIDYWTSTELSSVINILDSGDDKLLYYTLGIPVYEDPKESGFAPAYLDTTSTITMLDQASYVDSILRSIMFSYKFNFIENATEFMSLNSLKAIDNDCKQIKRKTEQMYYEPNLHINYGTSGQLITTNYVDYERLLSGSQKTMFFGSPTSFSSMINSGSVQLGSGALTTINSSISSVQGLVCTISAFDTLTSITEAPFLYRRKLYEKAMVPDFTEMACFTSSGQCFMYSTFPKVILNSGSFYSNIAFTFNLV